MLNRNGRFQVGKWFFSGEISSRSMRRAGVGAVLGVTLLAAAGTASAQQRTEDYNNWEITPFYGYMAGGEFEDPASNTDRDLDEDNDFGIIFNAAVDQWRHYELSVPEI